MKCVSSVPAVGPLVQDKGDVCGCASVKESIKIDSTVRDTLQLQKSTSVSVLPRPDNKHGEHSCAETLWWIGTLWYRIGETDALTADFWGRKYRNLGDGIIFHRVYVQ